VGTGIAQAQPILSGDPTNFTASTELCYRSLLYTCTQTQNCSSTGGLLSTSDQYPTINNNLAMMLLKEDQLSVSYIIMNHHLQDIINSCHFLILSNIYHVICVVHLQLSFNDFANVHSGVFQEATAAY